jgi:DNA-directed RNA polymerase alpha subunit
MEETPVLPSNMYDLGMCYRTTNALVRAGIKTPIDLVNSSYAEISGIRGIGKGAIKEIVETLNIYGYTISDYKEEL